MGATRQARALAALGAAAFALCVYLLTLAPSLDFIDAGELAAVAHTFGIAHPTGYPLFGLVAGLWARLPIGGGVFRLNVLAAVCVAVAVGLCVDAIWHLLGLRPGSARAVAPGSEPPAATRRCLAAAPGPQPPAAACQRLAAAVAGGLTIAFSRTCWRTALSVEVYSLHLLLLGLVLWTLARLLAAIEDYGRGQRTDRRAAALGLALGLAFANHMSTAFVLPAVVVALAAAVRRGALGKRALLAGGAAFAAGLLPYLYLPLRAAADPALNWGNPDTWGRFVRHVSGKQYQVWMFASAASWRAMFAANAARLPADLQYVALVAAAAGAVVACRRHALAGWLLVVMCATCLIWAAGYDILDIGPYLLLAVVVAGVWTAFAAAAAARWLDRWPRLGARGGAFVGLLFVLPLAGNAAAVSQRGNHLVDDYTRSMFASLERDALVLTRQWDYWVSAALYYQNVENVRTDVLVLDKELFRRSWYVEQLRVRHPEVYARARPQIEAFARQLERFEQDLPYEPATIEAAFNAMLASLLAANYDHRPVYVTIEIEPQHSAGFRLVPVGLAFRLYRPEDVPPLAELPQPELRWRPFAAQDRLPTALRGMYASMLLNRAVYAYRAGGFEAAAPLFERALEFAPEDAAVRRWQQLNEAARSRPGLAPTSAAAPAVVTAAVPAAAATGAAADLSAAP